MNERINHHLGQDLLMAYSAGTLPEAFSLIAAAHISLCDQCRADLAALDTVGGAVLDGGGAEPMSPDSLDAALAALDTPAGVRATPRRTCAVLPEPVCDYVGGSLADVRWRPVGLGVKQAILPTSKGASARLLFIPAGGAVPDHGHSGMELTMVLQGAFSDEVDRFARGDVETADESLSHTPVAEAGEDCICLAVTDAPLRFKSLIPRLLQPFLRI